jgi:hypothetical protein
MSRNTKKYSSMVSSSLSPSAGASSPLSSSWPPEKLVPTLYFARKVWYISGQLIINLDNKEYNKVRALSLRENENNLSLIVSGDALLFFMVSQIPKR